ncbi:MAG: hypothetical protein JNM70_02205 [Anaerolineae bacterium]|nr:hypothetical protein [Anaerolineae bacterium]
MKSQRQKVNSRVSEVAQGVYSIGLDIGYGVVKVVTATTTLAFPSVMGHARQINYQQEALSARYPGDQIADDDGTWFVGELALGQLPPGDILRLRGRTANEDVMGNAFRLRLAKVAIGKLFGAQVQPGEVVHLRIGTGLRVDHMRDAAALKQALLARRFRKSLKSFKRR